MANQRYIIEAERSTDTKHLIARVREFELELGAHRGDPMTGFNPVETLLCALAACLTTSLGMVAETSRIKLETVKISVEAIRQDKPPILTGIHYKLSLESDVDDQRVMRLVELAEKNSTVLTTLQQGVEVRGEWCKLTKQTQA